MKTRNIDLPKLVQLAFGVYVTITWHAMSTVMDSMLLETCKKERWYLINILTNIIITW